MRLITRVTSAILVIAMVAATVPVVTGQTAGTQTFYLHDNGEMDDAREAKVPAHPSTLVFAWNDSLMVFTSPALEAALTLPAGESVKVLLYRDAAFTNNYSTTVTLSYRPSGGGDTVLHETTVGPVPVDASHPRAPADAPDTTLVVHTLADTLLPSPYATLAKSLHDLVVPAYVDAVAGLVLKSPEPEPEADLQEDWERIVLDLPEDVTIPEGARVSLSVKTTYDGHPVDELPSDNVNFNEFARPDVVTYVDRWDTPSRVEFTLA